MTKHTFFIALAVFILTDCAVRPPLDFRPEDTSNGILVGSFTRLNGKPRYNVYSFYFEDSTGVKREITIEPERITSVKYPDDFDNGEVSGSVFAFTLPAGTYNLNGYYNVYQVTTTTYRYFIPSKEFNIPFTVKAGLVNYLGEIRFHPKLKDKYETEPKFFLGNYADGGSYQIHDSFNRDIELLKIKFKNIGSSKVLNITPLNAEIPVLLEKK